MPIGAIVGGASSALQAVMGQRDASRQRQFGRRMADTAHQRQVADLRAAGLNPILSATGGSGAAVPGAGGLHQGESIAGGMLGGQSARAARAQIDNIREQNQNLQAERARIGQDTALKQAQTRKERAQATMLEATRAPFDVANHYLGQVGGPVRAFQRGLGELGRFGGWLGGQAADLRESLHSARSARRNRAFRGRGTAGNLVDEQGRLIPEVHIRPRSSR